MSYKPQKRNNLLWERMFKKFFFKYFVTAMVVFTGSIFFINAEFFAVKNIDFTNTKNTDASYLRGIAKESLEGKYFELYNKSNFIFYPESFIESELLRQEKRIKSVNISYAGFSGDIEIDVEEKQAAFLYCPEGDKKKESSCYFMEQDGKIFTKFNQEETGVLKKDFLVFSEKHTEGEVPETYWEKVVFEKVLSLINELKIIDIEIYSIEKKEFEEIVLSTKNDSKIILLLQQDFNKIPETLKKISIRKDLRINKDEQDFATRIEYVNLSHGENLFYCIPGDECAGNY